MNTPEPASRQWNERSSASQSPLADTGAMFQLLFERSADAMSLYDPETGRFVESNEAVARQVGAPNKEALGKATVAEISPERQPDGRLSSEKAAEMVRLALAQGSHRFEWMSRRYDGSELPLDVVMTAIPFKGRTMLFVVSRDISAQKKAEQEILRLNASLEQRVAARTAELVRANDQLKEEIAERKRQERIQRRRSDQMQRHRDVMLELAQIPKSDFWKTLEMICSHAAAALDVARVSYWSLVDHSAIRCERLYLRDRQATDPEFEGARLCAEESPNYFAALAEKRPIVAHDALNNPATQELSAYLQAHGITAMLDAPVWVRGDVVGVLCHEHTGPAREWTAEEVDFVSGLAATISLAIEESRRAESEHRLRVSEEKFRALFEGSSQGVILHDEEKILEVNPACVRIMGFDSADEIIGKHPADFSAPIQLGGERADVLARRYIAECMVRGSARFDWITRNARGKETPIEVILTRIQLGDRVLIQALINDITERKRAEETLRQSEARLRESDARFSAAFRASPQFITISRLDNGRYVLVNDAFCKWSGYQADEVIGRDSKELSLWADPADREPFWEELRRTHSIRERECHVRSRHGRIYTMLLSADIIEINGLPHLLTVGLDITERKQAEAELLRTLAREKELGLLRSKFVSMVSHEFRTPLGIIQSSAEILDEYFGRLDPGERREHLKSIQRNTRRMAALMEVVLLIGSFDAGRMEFKPAPVDLERFVRDVIDDILSATERRCPIHLETPAALEPATADDRLLRHALTNLLTNAVKYSEPGKAVNVILQRQGAHAVFVIRDQGIGIPEEDREWLFAAFHRGSNVGDRPGTGLGLVIVKRCIDLHGGTIDVESALGAGTTITVRLPMFPSGAPPRAAQQLQHQT